MSPEVRGSWWVSHGYWQLHLGGGAVVGDDLILDGDVHSIVGVAPRSFFFPSPGTEIFVSAVLERGAVLRSQRVALAFGHLGPGVSVESATAEMSTLAAATEIAYPETIAGWSARVVSIRDNSAPDQVSEWPWWEEGWDCWGRDGGSV